jgi:GAF domain-containing protein
MTQFEDNGPSLEEARLQRGLNEDFRTRTLAEISLAFQEGSDPDKEVLAALFPVLNQELDVDAMLAYVIGDHAMELAFVRGFDEASVQLLQRLDFGQAICGTVGATGKPIYAPDIQCSEDPRADLVRSVGIDVYASEPLKVGERLVGTLSFGSRQRKSFSAQDLLFFRAIANLLADHR